MRHLLPVLALAALTAPSPLPAQTPATASLPAWQTAIQQRREALIANNGPGADIGLRDRLLKMRETDQTARGLIPGTAYQGTQQERLQNLAAVDTQLTAELKSIVADKGWPTIALVGIDASDAAMLVLTHTADHAWQLQLLPHLEQLADAGTINAAPLALVIDKQLVATGKPQRYGSQFKLVNGRMAMYAVEDPGGLDNLRARAMLPPMDVYKQQLARIYGLKPTNDIVTATPPTTP